MRTGSTPRTDAFPVARSIDVPHDSTGTGYFKAFASHSSRLGLVNNAMLLRNVPLVMRDVSSGGCSIESRTPLHVGMVGWLEVEFEGGRRFEWFRIARIEARAEGLFLAGVEFLPLSAAGSDSLRSAVGRLRRSTDAAASPQVAGRSSGDPANNDGTGTASPATSSSTTADSAGKVLDFCRRR
jgi:PilZ domain-containing protein